MEKLSLFEQYKLTTTHPSSKGFIRRLQTLVGSQKRIMDAWDKKITGLEEEIKLLKEQNRDLLDELARLQNVKTFYM